MEKFRITNNSSALQGVRLPSGAARYIRPGKSATVQLDEVTYTMADRHSFLVIKPVGDDDAPEPETTTETGDRAADIRAAIATLTDEQFNADGSPNLDALNEAMSDDAASVTSDERDSVWKEMAE